MVRVLHRRIGWAALLLAGSLIGTPVRADTPLAYATIEPQKITLGQSAIMRITSLGPGMGAFTMPVVQGLDFEFLGHANQVDFVNGASFPTSSVVLRVTAQFAGIYKIPQVTPQSQPLILEVVPVVSAAVPPPANSSRGSAAPVLPGASAARAAGLRLTSDGSAFLRLGVPKRDIFVGESVPVDIELGLRVGFVTAIHGLPALTGSQFTFNNLTQQPEHEMRKIDGKQYEVLIWRSMIAAVKPGDYSLAVETPLTVKIRTQSPEEAALDDMLGDQFYQNRFGAMVKKDITVASPATNFKVLALPSDGRPADFSGAVGDFKVASELSASSTTAGDPLTLRMHISGSGNFDRVDTSMFRHLDQWKTYPPTSSFKKSDAVGYKGEKVFEQPMIAAESGRQTLPPLSFNYFNPVARRYETASAAPLSVSVAAPLANSAPARAQTAAITAGQSIALRPDHPDSRGNARYLTPLYLRPGFLMLSSALALAFAGGLWFSGRPSEPGLSPAIKRQLASLDAAARAGDASRFVDIAQSALRAGLAQRRHDEPDVQRLFALADEAKYSGKPPDAMDFSYWRNVVRSQLTRRDG